MNILIVDDNARNLKLLRTVLENEGAFVHEAANGVAALDVLKSVSIDAVVSDILMPIMDGYALCSEIRNDPALSPALSNVPFIFYTATYNSPDDKKLGYEVGADGYLKNPDDLGLILKTIKGVLPSQVRKKVPSAKPASHEMKQYSQALIDKLEEKNLELNKIVAKLQEHEHSTLALIESVMDGIISIDSDQKVTVFNDAAQKMFGYSKEEVIGQSVNTLMPERFHHQHRIDVTKFGEDAIMRRFMHSVPHIIGRRSDGTEFPIESSISHTTIAGEKQYTAIMRDISDRLKDAAAQHEVTERFRQVVENINEVFWIRDIDKQLMSYVSPAYEKIWGQDISIPYKSAQSWIDATHPEDRQRVANAIKNQQEIPYNIEYRIVRPDGEIRWIHDRAFPVRDNQGKIYRIAGVANDITDRKKGEDALNESELRIRQMTENINEVFFLVDTKFKEVFYINSAYEKIWGVSTQSIYEDPRNFIANVHPEDKERVIDEMAPQGTMVQFDVEFRIIRPDGLQRNVRVRSFPILDAAGEVYRFAGVAEDITDHKIAESKMLQSQKMEAIGQLSGGIAHDFNNLLTVIMGYVEVLQMSNLTPDDLDSVAEIKMAGERATGLTRQLLLFARRKTIQMTTFDLNSSLKDTAKMLQRILGEDIEFEFRPFSSGPLPIEADAGMLDQVLMNLAVNARDAMPNGGLLLIETAQVEFDEESAKHSQDIQPGVFACLSVSDSGSGIPAEVIPNIFDPFFTTKDVGRGTGLGLPTVFGIIKQHKGWMNVYSDTNGTTFRVYLPLIKNKANTTSSIAKLTTNGKGGNETILVVEDEDMIRTLVCGYLTKMGYTVLSAVNGLDAVTTFNERKNQIDLVFTDIIMPGGMSGLELGALLTKEKPSIEVVYTSGYSDMRGKKNIGREVGKNFITKPYNLPQVAALIRSRLDLRENNTKNKRKTDV